MNWFKKYLEYLKSYSFLLKLSWKYTEKKYRYVIFQTLFIISSFLAITKPIILANTLNSLQNIANWWNLEQLFFWMKMLIIIHLWHWCFLIPARALERRTAFSIWKNYLENLYLKVSNKSINWFENKNYSIIVNKIINASDWLYKFSDNQFKYIEQIIWLLFSIIYIWFLIPNWIFYSLFLWVFFVIYTTIIDIKIASLTYIKNKKSNNLVWIINDFLNKPLNLKILNLEKVSKNKILENYQLQYEEFKKIVNLNDLKHSVLSISWTIFFLWITFIAIYPIMKNPWDTQSMLKIWSFVAIYLYSNKILDVVKAFTKKFEELLKQYVDIKTWEELVNSKDIFEEKDKSHIKNNKKLSWNITFKWVNFSYNDNKIIFKNLNLEIKSWEKVAIMWTSWSWKTSLIKLLLNIYKINSWKIEIDWVNIEDLDKNYLYEHFSYVPQEISLFHTSIKENISFWKQNSKIKEIKSAWEKAYLDEFINKLENGYDTIVWEEWTNLSGWQKQRIIIAQAILRNAPIIIFDEATSALDIESENYIKEILKTSMSEETMIVITHKISTIKNLDRIIILEDWEIIEDWSFEDLIKLNWKFKKLYDKQVNWFIW